MAYSTSNPPRLTSVSPLTGAGQTWAYRSTDAAGTVDGVGYFTNGVDLGLRVGDLMFVTDTSANLTTTHFVAVVGSTTTSLGTGTTVGSSADAD